MKLEMRDVSVDYGRHAVLKGINLEMAPGEMVGLIGPNGSGKSTIIKTLSRIIAPKSGSIWLNGRNIVSIPRRELARSIGVVPQVPILPSAFTAFEIVLMGRNPHLGLFEYEGQSEIAVAWGAMQKTSTQGLAARRVNELSGGEIQSLLVARVLAQGTEAVLLDEPTANLDIGRQVEILDIIRELCREGRTVLAALHDLNLACQYCDRIILINEGAVYAEGMPARVVTADNIRAVYGAERCVFTHPQNGLPAVLMSAHHRNGNGGVKA